MRESVLVQVCVHLLLHAAVVPVRMKNVSVHKSGTLCAVRTGLTTTTSARPCARGWWLSAVENVLVRVQIVSVLKSGTLSVVWMGWSTAMSARPCATRWRWSVWESVLAKAEIVCVHESGILCVVRTMWTTATSAWPGAKGWWWSARESVLVQSQCLPRISTSLTFSVSALLVAALPLSPQCVGQMEELTVTSARQIVRGLGWSVRGSVCASGSSDLAAQIL